MGFIGGQFMSASVNPDIVTDGLVLCLDAANSDCFRGESTVNLVPNGNLYGMSNITLTFVEIENGWKKYSMSGTFTGGSYPYIMRIEANSFTAGVIYSSACTIKTNVLHKFNYFGTVGLSYVNVPRSPTGTQSSVINSDDSRTIKCENFAYTSTTVQNGYIWSNPINNTTFNSSTDFVWIKDLQIEQKPYSTQFVNGTRGSTVATGGGLVDLSGNNNHGTIVRAASPTAAFYNQSNKGSLVFNGSNDYISVPYSSTLAPTNAISFSTFAYLTNWNITSNVRILSKTESGGYQIGLNEGTMESGYLGGLIYAGGGYRVTRISRSSISTGWHHVQFTFDGRYFKMYLDAENVSTYDHGSITTIGYSWNNHLAIGTEASTGTGVTANYWPGSISVVTIYNEALSPTQVLQNYKALKGRYGL
jgi:hypothetical protein